VITASITLASGGGAGGISANCPSGYYAMGGGAESMTKLPSGLNMYASNPNYNAASGPIGWYANATNNTNQDIQLKSYVICVPKS
jgi:hypothetical protein